MNIENVFYKGTRYQGYDESELKELGVPDDVILVAKNRQIFDHVQNERKNAYVKESDPIFIEWQYDQTEEKEKAWRDKVAEIKARYPLPEDAA
ncbi:hypothetical protein ACS0KQ_003253 [Vibrio cholerae]